jgi:predicted nucleic acid-binding protein
VTALIDTSAWIAYLRDDDAESADDVEALLVAGIAVVTDQVILELLAGAKDDQDLHRLNRLVASVGYEAQETPDDAELAAGLYRSCRRAGETPRSLGDCVIGAVAVRTGLPVLHRDRDFDVLSRHAGVRVA